MMKGCDNLPPPCTVQDPIHYLKIYICGRVEA